MVIGGSNPALTQGGTGGGGTVSDQLTQRTDVDTRLDLGQSGPGGGQTFDTSRDVAVVETTESISDAGGPDAVLAGTQEQVQNVRDAVSDASRSLEPAVEPPVDVPQSVTAARNAAAEATENVPTPGGDGEALGVGTGVLVVIGAILALLFGVFD